MPVNDIQIVEIPCGMGGLNTSQAISGFPITDLRTVENISFEDDTCLKEGGSSKINTTVITAAPVITGAWDFWPASGTQKRIVATSNGYIYSVGTGGVVDTLKSSWGSDNMTTFLEALGASSTRKLFIFNGHDVVQVTSDGVTAADISHPPADWTGNNQPMAGVIHNGRLFAFGNVNAPHRIYYTPITDNEDFTGTGSGSLNVYPGEGEKLAAAFSFAGRLFIWKYPRGIYWVDDSDTTPANWFISRLTRSVGMAGPLGLGQIDNDVLFMSPEGLVHCLATVQEYGDAKASSILPDKIAKYIRDNIRLDRLNRAQTTYYPSKKQWRIALTHSGYNRNNRQLIIDLHSMQNPRYTLSSITTCESLTLTRDSDGLERPMAGDDAGFLWLQDEPSRNKDSGAYLGSFETADIELVTKGIKRGNLQYLEAIFRPLGDHNLTVDVYADGLFTQTVTLGMGGGIGGALGAFVLGTSILGGGDVRNARKRLYGDARRVRLKAYNSGINESFSVASFLLGVTPGNERP